MGRTESNQTKHAYTQSCKSMIMSTFSFFACKMAAKPKVYKDGEYTDPVYKKLARINGEINKLTKKELQEKLKELHIDDR